MQNKCRATNITLVPIICSFINASTLAESADVSVAVYIENIVMPNKIHNTANKRAIIDFGARSPYLEIWE